MTRSIRPLVAGNWKMNGLKADLAIATEVARGYDASLKAAVDLAICPPSTLLFTATAALIGSRIASGGQDCSLQPAGAFTGEVSAAMLADAGAMARLASDLRATPAKNLRGVIWFRLPVPRDRMNWHATTFATVLRGEIPTARLAAQVEWNETGLAEIVIVNTGQTTEPLPSRVELRWPAEARVLAADGLRGFQLEIRAGEAQGIVRAANVTPDASVAPGGKARIAWLRFAHEVSLEVSLPAAP